MKIYISIFIVLAATGVLLSANKWLQQWRFLFSNNAYVDNQIKYQTLLLLTALGVLILTYLLNKESFISLFSIGNINAPTEKMPLFGIKEGDKWLETGLSLSVVITSVTAIFMYYQLKPYTVNWHLLAQGMGWILLFSLTNSFGEEAIYRLGILSPLKGMLPPTSLFLISAVLFGIPHFAGMPNGMIGVLMASILGFVLAKSVYETNGIFWAWLIHFLQDVVIIGTIYMMKMGVETLSSASESI
jgi:membrane protease YdiL (CAAX protease family)